MTIGRKRNVLLVLSVLLTVFAVTFILFSAKPAYAGTVRPSGKTGGYTDRSRIQKELDKHGKVTLVKGKTYYTDGPLKVKSNQTIIATGATIICHKTAMFNIPQCADYKAIKNFKIDGGTWKYYGKSGYHGSTIKITHGDNIQFLNMTIRHANANGHSIELVACKNVKVYHCNIGPLGSSNSQTEESIQLDVASHPTAYFLESKPFNTKIASKLQNGACCHNVQIDHNYIFGNRGVVANYTRKSNGKYLRCTHSNIKITNNTIIGTHGEGVSLFNTTSATVKNNFIASKASGSGSAYTIGLHFACFGNSDKLKDGKINVINNTIKGGRQALQVYSHTSAKYGQVTVKNNKCYCKRGADNAIKVLRSQCKKVIRSGNKLNGWNGK